MPWVLALMDLIFWMFLFYFCCDWLSRNRHCLRFLYYDIRDHESYIVGSKRRVWRQNVAVFRSAGQQQLSCSYGNTRLSSVPAQLRRVDYEEQPEPEQQRSQSNHFFQKQLLVYFKVDCHLIQGRDLAIAYVLVAATYVGIGATFYLSFPLEKNCIADVRNKAQTCPLHSCWVIVCQLFFNCFAVELAEQLYRVGRHDGGGPHLPSLSNDDRVPSAGVHLESADPLRYFQLDLSESPPRHCVERAAAYCVYPDRHLSSRSWNHHSVGSTWLSGWLHWTSSWLLIVSIQVFRCYLRTGLYIYSAQYPLRHVRQEGE